MKKKGGGRRDKPSARATPPGGRPTGKKPAGKKPAGKKPAGKKPAGKKPAGKKPAVGAPKKQPAASAAPADARRKAEHVTARRANVRERDLFNEEREPVWLRVSLDAIARHRAAREPLDRALEHTGRAARLGPRERRRAGDLVFAWARSRLLVEDLVQQALKRFGGVPPPVRERDRAALLLAALASDLEPVNSALPSPLAELVEEAADLGVGALSDADRAPLPAWLEKRLHAHYQDRADALMAALREPAPVVIAFDRRHLDRAALLSALQEMGVRAEPSSVSPYAVRVSERFSLAQLPPQLRPHVWPMDDGSQAVVLALDVKEGERVLDLCAGGGGKARLLMALGARVVAFDPDKSRLAAVKSRNRGETSLACVRGDGRHAPFSAGSFDKVLVDAPCSGTGTLRRAPDVADRFSPAFLDELVALQADLLRAASALVREGGRVVYATCSLLPEENDGVVKRAVEESRGLALIGTDTLLPSERGTDGFFIATLTRG